VRLLLRERATKTSDVFVAPARAFHEALPGYAVTPLHAAPSLAEAWGVGQVWMKDETSRLGLPAFKVLGASWAAHRALTGRDPAATTLVTASAGNHGRAVAHVARLLGARARVLVPAGTVPARIDAIAGEGADVEETAGDYDAAVAQAAELAAREPGHLLLQDTAWPGYEEIPGWIVDGYGTLFAELRDQLAAAGAHAGLVLLPVGVGSLATAGVRAFEATEAAIVSVEPEGAACLLESLAAGAPVTLPAPHSIMAGLTCGTVSSSAWPVLRDGLDGALAVSDDAARAGMDTLRGLGIAAGECSGGSVGAAAELLTGPAREEVGASERSEVVLLLTEGVTGARTASGSTR
jgi:diaminopropionate ammonia-lyase